MEAVILAGGRGTRLGALTKSMPKPMLPVHGRPFLEHLIRYWQKQGIGRFILSLGFQRETIEKYFSGNEPAAEIVYSVEPEPLGTGGGMLCAANRLTSPAPFLILNGDTFFEVSLKELVDFHAQKKAAATLALAKKHAFKRYEGVNLDADEKIVSWVERNRDAHSVLIYGGVCVLDPSLLRDFFSFRGKWMSMETDFFPGLISSKQSIYGFVSEGRFIDIGTPADYARASKILVE